LDDELGAAPWDKDKERQHLALPDPALECHRRRRAVAERMSSAVVSPSSSSSTAPMSCISSAARTGKINLSVGLGVEAIKARHSVYFTTLSDLVGVLSSKPNARAPYARRSDPLWLCTLHRRRDGISAGHPRVVEISSSSSSTPDTA
jgi:hypothetical protein